MIKRNVCIGRGCHRIRVGDSKRKRMRERLRNEIGKASYFVDRDATEMGLNGATALVAELTSKELGAAIRFGYGHGAPITVLEGLPISGNLPPTQVPFGDDSLVQTEDSLLLGAIETIGAHPIAYDYENNGRLMRNVAPLSRETETASSQGAKVALGWHTDNPWPFERKFLDRSPSPRFLCFFGLRVNDGDGVPVPTEVLPIAEVLQRCPFPLVEQLMRSQFRVNPPESNDCEPLNDVPLLEVDSNGRPALLRFNADVGQIEGITPTASSAIDQFRSVLTDCEDLVINVVVEPGSVLIFDNYRVLHRRKSFDPGDNMSEARWLRRCYACMNPDSGFFVDRRHRPFVWR
jgi:L-asparagine oxygenase